MDIDKINELKKKIEALQKSKDKEAYSIVDDTTLTKITSPYQEELELYKYSKKLIKNSNIFLQSSRGNLSTFILGEEIKNEYGICFSKKKIYLNQIANIAIPIDYSYLQGLSKICNIKDIDLRKSLFLDIETTNIESGAGNAAYLIGIGYFDNSCFIVQQLFMRDFDEEAAILSSVNDKVLNFNFLFTFNGKRFDINVLENRYKINRLPFYLSKTKHIDILDYFRKLFGNKSNIKLNLTYLEQDFLNFKRIIEIPSYLIPEVYYQYLRTGYSDLIEYVFEHNAQDVSSLAGLTLFLDASLNYPEQNEKIASYIYHFLGKISLKEKKNKQAKEYFLKAMKYKMHPRIYLKNCAQLCRIYINEKKYKEATNLWINLFSNNQNILTPFELKKIAIHFERYDKDLVKAFYFAMEGKKEITQKEFENNKIKKDFEKRTLRLIKKILKDQ